MIFGDDGLRLLAHLRREVDQVIDGDAIAGVGWRLRGEGLRRRIPLARRVAFLHRAFLDRPDRLAGDAIEYIKEALLTGLSDYLHGLALDGDVGQDRRRRDVHIPKRMV